MMRKIGTLFSIFFMGISVAGLCVDGLPRANEGDGKKQTASSPKDYLTFSAQQVCTVAAVFPPQTDEHEKKIVEDFKGAQACLREASDDRQKLSAYQLLRDLAVSGHIPSVLVLGDICSRRKEDIDALKWYVHAFHLQWFRTGEWEETAQDKLTKVWLSKFKKKASVQISNFKAVFQKKPLSQLKMDSLSQFFSIIYSSYVQNGIVIEPFCQPEETLHKQKWILDVRDKHRRNLVCVQLGSDLMEKADYPGAIKAFMQASSPVAFCCLGILYNKNLGEHEKAAYYFEKSGIPAAVHGLARLYFDGHIGATEGVPDYKRVAELCESSISRHAEFTYPSTYDILAFLYLKGFYGAVKRKPNFKRAIELYSHSRTAESFDNLGLLYSQGRHDVKQGKPDYVSAAKYFEIAGVRGANNLGCLYYRGRIGRLENRQPDFVKAAQCFELSNCSKSFLSLGNLYYYGLYGAIHGTPAYDKALEYYRKSDVPEARLYAGIIHLNDTHLCQALYNQPHNFEIAWKEFDSCTLLIAKAYQLYMMKEHQESLREFLSQDVLDTTQKTIVALIEAEIKKFKAKSREQEFYRGMLAYGNENYDDAYMYLSNATFRDVWGAHFFMQIAMYHKKRIELELAPLAGSDVEEEEDDDSLEFLESVIEASLNKSSPPSAAVEKMKLVEVVPVSPVNIKSSLGDKHNVERAPLELLPERLLQYKPEIKKRTPLEKLRAQLLRINKMSLRSFETDIDPDRAETEEEPARLEIKFLSPAVEKAFERLKESKKMRELLDDIQMRPYALEGAGQPEILKGKFLKKYRGCYSRRINDEDRLVYRVTGRAEIFIFSCEGHYDD
ncbi:MAG: type II toxin-antitoxin system YoeB family toxin [Alphaproteobacteria bacterium]|jgi:toxin YoeB|nr:type II toxin-antitoxin system YoeB family toxin [Alphaproteobacteria bacterium]